MTYHAKGPPNWTLNRLRRPSMADVAASGRGALVAWFLLRSDRSLGELISVDHIPEDVIVGGCGMSRPPVLDLWIG